MIGQAGTAGARWQTMWGQTGGAPTAGTYDTTANGVLCDNTTTGAIPVYGTSTYLTRFEVVSNQAGHNMVCSRLWHNGGILITGTSLQTIVSPTWNAVDLNQATVGEGVLLAVEVSATVGAATPTLSIGYTNQAGSSGQVSTNIYTTVSASGGATCYLMDLQAGDTGVRRVDSITLSASWISGTINIAAYKPLVMVGNSLISSRAYVDAYTGGLPNVTSNCLYLMGTSNEVTVIGQMLYSNG